MSTNGLLTRELAELRAVEGFQSRGRTITETDLVSFAALTGDWHPQHADASWAASSRFGRRVAHGMLVLSYAIGLVPLDPSRVVALRGLDGVVFKRPVHIGDTIRVEGRIEGTRPLDQETALLDLAWRILNQSDEVVARARLTVVWRLAERLSAIPREPDQRPDGRPLPSEVFL